MSRRTKTDLEAENKELRRELEILRENYRELSELFDWEILKAEIINDARTSDVDQHIHFMDRNMPHIVRGQQFSGNSRGLSALYRLAADILREHGADYPTKEVIAAAKSHPTIQEIDDSHIFWTDDNGRETKTTLHAFDTRLSKIRKIIR